MEDLFIKYGNTIMREYGKTTDEIIESFSNIPRQSTLEEQLKLIGNNILKFIGGNNMYDFEKNEDKLLMLRIMKERGWETETDKDSLYEEVKEEYNRMIADFEDGEDLMYPNGRDFEAENFDD